MAFTFNLASAPLIPVRMLVYWQAIAFYSLLKPCIILLHLVLACKTSFRLTIPDLIELLDHLKALYKYSDLMIVALLLLRSLLAGVELVS